MPTAVVGVKFSPQFVCVSICFFRTISQKSMQLGSPNLTHKRSTMSPGNPFILGSKGQTFKVKVTSHKHIAGFILLWVLASSRYHLYLHHDYCHSSQRIGALQFCHHYFAVLGKRANVLQSSCLFVSLSIRYRSEPARRTALRHAHRVVKNVDAQLSDINWRRSSVELSW